MIALVLDTHAAIWLLHGDSRLSRHALEQIDAATQRGMQIAISSLSLVETAYLEEKGRIPAGTLEGLLALLSSAEPVLVEVPVTRHIIQDLMRISCISVPDMPDRVIAATALSLGVPLVSRDGQVRDSEIVTVW